MRRGKDGDDGDRNGRRPGTRPWGRWPVVAGVTAFLLVVGVGGYVLVNSVRPYLRGSNCQATTPDGEMPLDLEQAANASTISAVAFGKRLPERAVAIAFATSIQESRIRNLAHGDRDSVGMFQQRPSQGWGTEAELRDPVTATRKFFDGLEKINDYLDRDLHDAAQLVQRSADGRAYAQHEDDAKVLARAYTGRQAAAVRCWYTPKKRTEPRRAEALKELRRSFGGRIPPSQGDAVEVSGTRAGWAVASWAVSHAQPYGLREIRFAGRRWRAESGHEGWTESPTTSPDRVIIR